MNIPSGEVFVTRTAGHSSDESPVMATTTKTIAHVLNSLIETCKDGQEGFRSASEDVSNNALKNFFHELSIERGRFGTELQRLVVTLGEDAESGGSVPGSLHRGWIDLKSALSSGDEYAILAECERGEDSAVAEYRDALEHDELPESVHDVILRQYLGVKESHDRVRDLRDAYKR
jgi:uncharacterized protein (TIGR02284 family)